ncbi:hypothetical protein VSU16_16135 (plasmid) [Cetobacterium somerae]|uniref:hypothetical protein n=1 Tax=Cetobacterium somerae TaxID=188913 RepID=UPI002E7BE677|nr:hypothetical protein [Cetobacterium somerae]WVJ03356.1 hypothetical protein VSU16_16135 [Cetobacterium somerae]
MVDNKFKYLIKGLKNVFNIDEINKIAKESKFMQRKSSIKPEDFLIFNTLHGVPSGKRGITTLRIFLTIDAPFIFNVFRPFFIQKFSQVI